jgi:hypothetical protein
MKIRSFFIAIVFAFSAITAAGQKCPTIGVSGPSDDPLAGTPITFVADVQGGDKDVTPTFNWTVSAGTISSGQGTSVITVDTTRADGSITATVEMGGYDRTCNTVASSTAYVRVQPKARKIDEYGTLKTADEQARLDNYAIELQNDPTAQGYVLTYRGNTTTALSAKAVGQKAMNYLVNTRGIDSSRMIFVYGGAQLAARTELWVVPSGATPPAASPEPLPRVMAPRTVPKKKA